MFRLFCLEVAFQVNTSAGYSFLERRSPFTIRLSFRLFSRAETCIQLFPQRLSRESERTNATNPIGTMGGDGSSFGCGSQRLYKAMKTCLCCFLSH